MEREKNPRGRRKKRKKTRAGRLEPGLKRKLGISHPSAELGAKIYGAELPVMSLPHWFRAQELDAWDAGAEMCKLGASNDGVELRVQILKSFLQGHIC